MVDLYHSAADSDLISAPQLVAWPSELTGEQMFMTNDRMMCGLPNLIVSSQPFHWERSTLTW